MGSNKICIVQNFPQSEKPDNISLKSSNRYNKPLGLGWLKIGRMKQITETHI